MRRMGGKERWTHATPTFRVRARVVASSSAQLDFVLCWGEARIRLGPHLLTVGRGADCEIVLDSLAVSRRHARFGLRDGVPFVIDLDSANGVFVNGGRFQGEKQLRAGDVIVIGDQELRVVAERTELPLIVRAAETAARADTLWEGEDEELAPGESTNVQDAIELLGAVAERFMDAGQAQQARDVLAPRLEQLVERTRAGKLPTPRVAENASRSAIRLALVTGEAVWLNCALTLYLALDQMLPEDILVLMHEAVRKLPRIDLGTLRTYIARMSAARLSSHERFLLRRLEGLERVAALR